MTDEQRIAANNHASYMRGWKHGACINAMDPAFTPRDPSDPIRGHYEAGYSAGRSSRGHAPQVLRFTAQTRGEGS